MTGPTRRFAALLVVACALCYGAALGGTFHYDDFHSIVENRALRDVANIPAYFADPALFSHDPAKAMYRPLLLTTYALNYAVAGYEASAWLGTNLVLHMAAVLVLWALARRLLDDDRAALGAALVFAVHPLTSEPVNYVSSRSELLAAALYLSSVAAYVRSRQLGARPTASVGLFAAALLCKSTAITLPLVLALYEVVLRPAHRGGAQARRVGRSLLGHGLVAGAYVAAIAANGFLSGSLATPVRGPLTQAATQLKAPAYYLKLIAVPWGQSVEHQFLESSSLLELPVLLSGALCLSALGLAVAALRRRDGRLPALAALWGALVLVPTAVVPLNVLVNERRLYLVVAALALALGAGLRRRERRRLLLALPLLALLTAARNPVWASELSLWQDAVAKGPLMPRVHMNLGKALQHDGQWAAALTAYERALALDPERGDAYNNVGTLLHDRGDVDGAIAWYRRGLAAAPRETAIHLNLAQALTARGDLDGACEIYRQSLALAPDNGVAWSNYAEALVRARHWNAAEAAARRATELEPERAEAHNNLGNALSGRGDDAGAVEAYRVALSLTAAPTGRTRASILANLGDSYRRLGRTAEARRALGEALETDADMARAHYYEGRLEMDLGQWEAASRALTRAAVLDSGHVNAAVMLAEAEARLGRQARSVQLLERALRLDPGHTRAWYTLAEALDSLDRPGEAARAYGRFAELWGRRDDRYRHAVDRRRELGGGL